MIIKLLCLFILNSTYVNREFSNDTIYNETEIKLKLFKKTNKYKSHVKEKIKLNINPNNFKKRKIDNFLNLFNINKSKHNKYYINGKVLTWSNTKTFHNLRIKIKNKVLINPKNDEIVLYYQKIKKLAKIKNTGWINRIKIKILKYLLKINENFFIKFVFMNYCNCNIEDKEIKK